MQNVTQDEIRAVLQRHVAQDSKQPEQHINLSTELGTLQNQTQAGDSERLLEAAYQSDASGTHSQTAESKRLPSSMAQKEEPEDLPSDDTNQTGSGGLSSITQKEESDSLSGDATYTAAARFLPIAAPSAAETSVAHNAHSNISHHSTERTRSSGSEANSTAQMDAVLRGESHTAGASTSSSSAVHIPASGALPDRASQKAHSGSLPSSASQTAASGKIIMISPDAIPKTAKSLPSITSAAATSELLSSSTAQRAASDTRLSTTAQIGAPGSRLGGKDPAALCTEFRSAPTTESVVFSGATLHDAYSDTAALQASNTLATPLAGSTTQYSSLPGSPAEVTTMDTDGAAVCESGRISSLSNCNGDTDHRLQVSRLWLPLVTASAWKERRMPKERVQSLVESPFLVLTYLLYCTLLCFYFTYIQKSAK